MEISENVGHRSISTCVRSQIHNSLPYVLRRLRIGVGACCDLWPGFKPGLFLARFKQRKAWEALSVLNSPEDAIKVGNILIRAGRSPDESLCRRVDCRRNSLPCRF